MTESDYETRKAGPPLRARTLVRTSYALFILFRPLALLFSLPIGNVVVAVALVLCSCVGTGLDLVEPDTTVAEEEHIG